MVALKLSIAASELAVRMRERLRGNAVATAPSVVWQRPDGQRLLIELTTLKLRIIDGWLLCDFGVQTDQTGRTNLQVVFFLGRRQEADGLQAAVTINAATPAATQVAAVWGDDIQRVLWDVVLDALEASIWQTSERLPGQKITMQGFHCTPNMFEAEVLAEPVRIVAPVPGIRPMDAEEGHE